VEVTVDNNHKPFQKGKSQRDVRTGTPVRAIVGEERQEMLTE
jgi:hypothetical protein